jgi:hypothetical protein
MNSKNEASSRIKKSSGGGLRNPVEIVGISKRVGSSRANFFEIKAGSNNEHNLDELENDPRDESDVEIENLGERHTRFRVAKPNSALRKEAQLGESLDERNYFQIIEKLTNQYSKASTSNSSKPTSAVKSSSKVYNESVNFNITLNDGRINNGLVQ